MYAVYLRRGWTRERFAEHNRSDDAGANTDFVLLSGHLQPILGR